MDERNMGWQAVQAVQAQDSRAFAHPLLAHTLLTHSLLTHLDSMAALIFRFCPTDLALL